MPSGKPHKTIPRSHQPRTSECSRIPRTIRTPTNSLKTKTSAMALLSNRAVLIRRPPHQPHPVPRSSRLHSNRQLSRQERMRQREERWRAPPRVQQEAPRLARSPETRARVPQSVQLPVQWRADAHKRRPPKPPSSKRPSRRRRLSNNNKPRQQPNISNNWTHSSELFPHAWMHADIQLSS